MAETPLHVAFVTPEMAPFVKTGGLADISGALPKALVRLGHRVTVLLPRYGSVPFPPGEYAGSAAVAVDGAGRQADFFRTRTEAGVEVVFVEHGPFFGSRSRVYGEGDDRLRFAFLARAAIEYFRVRGERPSLFHAHDWQAGLVPVYLKARYWDDPALGRMPSVFSIHNVAYQGQFGLDTLGALGLPWNLGQAYALEYHGGLSYLKGGTVFAEMVNTVSPTYAPQDPSGKAACKADLLRAFSLPEFPDLPLVGVISRLVWLKGFDIVATAWWDFVERPLRMVVLGTGEHGIEQGLRQLQARDPDRFAARFAYDEGLAHRVMAGSDLFLMPSRSEPCGLTQMYALRYGTVPVVRSTGGLVDTVEPFDPARGTGTGFRFDTPDGTGLVWALDQALAARGDRQAWAGLMQRGMSRDFSWDRSAREYVELYRRAADKA